ncbi:MAG: SDR family NAD(P)-dependent oxidoreductase [Mariniblastus sp.]|nr:SDR family NAD(P)-dependent oxidoreductase [Mariniblastus sp.]
MPTFWKEKTVVITGGSRGLGLAIGKAFAAHSANVVLIGRDVERLESARSEILDDALSQRVDTFCLDITDEAVFEQRFEQLIETLETVDVWVNCAGKSIRCDLETSLLGDYRELMEINFFAAVRCSLAALPLLKRSRGHLINIGSLSSKTAWPYVAPYATSKHALSAFTQQLRIEGPSEVHYLQVCPGPISRDDTVDRYREQTAQLGEAAKQAGAGAPVGKIAPDQLAEKIVRACQKRSVELVVPWHSRLLFSISQLFPRLGDWILKRLSRK